MAEEAEMGGPFGWLCWLEARFQGRANLLSEERTQPGQRRRHGTAFWLQEWPLVTPEGVVREVLMPQPVTRVPGTRPWVLGITNVHGNPVPVVDLAAFFWGERTPPQASNRILLVVSPAGMCGVLVSSVAAVSRFSVIDGDAAVVYPPELDGYLLAKWQGENFVWGEFDLEALLERPEFADLSAG